MSYNRVETSAEVFAVIRARHPEMRVFGSDTDMDGGRIFTSYGFRQGDFPVIEAETTWDISLEKRVEHHRYWLCLPIAGGNP